MLEDATVVLLEKPKVLRQTKWKIKKYRNKRCINCGKLRGQSPYKRRCVKCAVRQRVKHGKAYNHIPWKPGMRGRPPMVVMPFNVADSAAVKKETK